MLAEMSSATPPQGWAIRVRKSDHLIVPMKRVMTAEGRGWQNNRRVE